MKRHKKYPHQQFQAPRKVLRDFMQNPIVAAKVIVGMFDAILPSEVINKLKADREKDPELVKIAQARIDAAIAAGKVKAYG